MGNRSRLLTATFALVLAGAGALAGPTAASAPDPSKGTVSIKAPAAAIAGEPIVFKGRLSLRRAGLKVGLQRKVGDGWKNVSQGVTKDKGRYRLSGTVQFGGVYKFRVIRLPWLTTSAKSRTVQTIVYEAEMLENIAANYGTWHLNAVSWDEDVDIAGARYSHSVEIDADSQGSDQGGWIEVDLAGLECAAFDAVVGALDGNSATSEVGAKVIADGENVVNSTYALGQSERVTLDIRGVDTLRIEGVVAKEGPQGDLGIGDPRLYCAS